MKLTSFLLAITLATTLRGTAAETHLPIILWITSEDHGPHMGC